MHVDKTIKRVLQEISNKYEITEEDAIKIVDGYFKLFKVAANNNLLPRIDIGRYLVIKPNEDVIKNKILLLSTDPTERHMVSINRYESILKRKLLLKNAKTYQEKNSILKQLNK